MPQLTVVTVQQAIQNTEAYIAKNGGLYSQWYAGVASKPEDRLFSDHNVTRNGGAWSYADLGTDTAARKVEDYFLNKGCKGAPGGGDWSSHFFYVYQITNSTRE